MVERYQPRLMIPLIYHSNGVSYYMWFALHQVQFHAMPSDGTPDPRKFAQQQLRSGYDNNCFVVISLVNRNTPFVNFVEFNLCIK